MHYYKCSYEMITVLGEKFTIAHEVRGRIKMKKNN